MGLLSTEVEVGSAANIQYYENKGYVFPRVLNKWNKYVVPRGTKIKVKISDLKEGSHALVKVKCDNCGDESDLPYIQYLTAIKGRIANGDYYCPNCISKLNRGENHHSWNPALTQEEREINRYSTDGYSDFIKKVMERDNYTCQVCGKPSSSDMVVHHLNGYHWFKEGRIDPKNALCLCGNCHENFHNSYGKKNNTKEQFEEWLGYALKELADYNGELPRARKVFCIETDSIYNNAIEAASAIGVDPSRIYDVCNHVQRKKPYPRNGKVYYYTCKSLSANGKHVIWYDEYKTMQKEDIIKTIEEESSHFQKVICITTGKIFNSLSSASRYYNCSKHISDCCKGKRQTCGQLPDGTRLQWMYYDDYLNNMNSNLKEAS